MNGDESTLPDTTSLRRALAPQLLPQVARILEQVQTIRAWATQTPVLSDVERADLLAQMAALEHIAQALTTKYAAFHPQHPS